MKSTRIVESADDQVIEETLVFDGREAKSEFMHSPRPTTAQLRADGPLEIKSVISPVWAPGTTLVTSDDYTLDEAGTTLTIHRVSQSPRGEQKQTLVFVRR